jgi:dTMP kinase
MIIAFCGMDGSGKTTLSRALKNELIKKGYSAAVIEPFRYILFDPILKLLRKTEGGAGFGHKKNKFWLFRLWPLLALFDHWVQFLFRIRPLAKNFDYVICDRFFWDFAASFNYFGYTTPWIEKLYLRLIPEPDITFVLDLPPEEARQREQGVPHPAEFFAPQRKFYLKIAKKHNLEILNSAQKLKSILGDITRTRTHHEQIT